MFGDLLIHPQSLDALEEFINKPSSVLMLTGPENIGKHAIARHVAARLLNVNVEELIRIGMYREVLAVGATISIEQIRDLFHFFALKTTGKSSTRRVVVIPDAEQMNQPAQNALLKMLEEPPEDAVLILTSSVPHKLLPTITSRTQKLLLRKPAKEAVKDFFSSKYSTSELDRAFMMTGGRIGAMIKLLGTTAENGEIGLNDVKQILSLPVFDQLVLVETTLKDKTAARQFIESLSQISAASLMQTAGNVAAMEQWKRISSASYVAGEALAKNANPKLVLLELMLSLRA